MIEQSMQGNNFEYATDFINQSLPFFDSSPLNVLQPDRTVKLGNLTKLA